MHLGVDRLLEAINASLKDRHGLDTEGRRAAVDGLAGFGAGPLEEALKWCRIGACDAVRFDPASPQGTGAVLYLHGGAFVAGSPVSHQYLTRELANRAGMTVYSLAYRLAPENKHPRALDDVIAAYSALITTGRYATVALAGDSAGATLAALAADRLCRSDSPTPSALGLISPLLDLRCVDPAFEEFSESDPIISRDNLRNDVEAYLGGQDAGSPAASPLLSDLRGLPPALVQTSDCEVLLGDSIKFTAKAERANVDITLRLYRGMVHVWHLFPKYVAEADEAIEELARFLARHSRHPTPPDAYTIADAG